MIRELERGSLKLVDTYTGKGLVPIDRGETPDFAYQDAARTKHCLLYTSPSPRDGLLSRMPSSA